MNRVHVPRGTEIADILRKNSHEVQVSNYGTTSWLLYSQVRKSNQHKYADYHQHNQHFRKGEGPEALSLIEYS